MTADDLPEGEAKALLAGFRERAFAVMAPLEEVAKTLPQDRQEDARDYLAQFWDGIGNMSRLPGKRSGKPI